MTEANVTTPKGRVVHRARRTWEDPPMSFRSKHHGAHPLRAAVVCNRVPIWHAFRIVNDKPVDCPGCLVYIQRNGNTCGLPYVAKVVVT